MITIYSLPGMPQRYALGLAWRHVDGAPGVAERRALTTTESRWGVVRKTSANPATYQVGYGALPEGTKNVSSVRPMALYIADMHVAPWLGVFKLEDDLYWLLAVRDNNEIIPEGDVVGGRLDLRALAGRGWPLLRDRARPERHPARTAHRSAHRRDDRCRLLVRGSWALPSRALRGRWWMT